MDVATNRGIKGGLQYCSGLVLSVDAIEIIEKSLGIRRKKVDDWDLEIDEIVEEICSGNIANIKK